MSNESLRSRLSLLSNSRSSLPQRFASSKIARLAKATLDRFVSSDKRVNEIDERIAALVNSQIQTEENVKKTDENLRDLIAVVDRYFSEGRNGGSKN